VTETRKRRVVRACPGASAAVHDHGERGDGRAVFWYALGKIGTMNAELRVEQWPTDKLVDYARNPRKNDAVVDKMCAAIREFGFRIPIVAKSDGSVVDGHLRLKAARKLGLETVPVALADDLTEAQIKAFRLLANRSAAWAEWDDELLALELGELQVEGFDLELTGFDAGELAQIFLEKEDGETDANAEWHGMPECNSEDQTAFRKLTVNFACQADVNRFEELIEQKLSDKVRSIWFPKAEINTYADKRYE
jgi:hypothetical protein